MATPNPTCPPPMKATSNGAFQHENPLDYALPLLILQICLVVIFTRFLAFLLKPLRQPRVIAEVIVSFLSITPFSLLSSFNKCSACLVKTKKFPLPITNDSLYTTFSFNLSRRLLIIKMLL